MDFRSCLLSCLAAMQLTMSAVAQQPGATFRKCSEYATQIDQLNDAFLRQQAAVAKVVDTIRELQPRIEQSEQKLQQLMEQRGQTGYQRLMLDAVMSAVKVQPRDSGGNVGPLTQVETARMVAQLGVQSDWMQHQINTFELASRIAMQQRLSLVEQLKTLLEEYNQYHTEQLHMFDKYWELADVSGERSDCERQAARRALDRSSIDNPGAIFLRAMLVMRTDKLDEASAWLDELVGYEEIRYVVLAARGELEARQGKVEEALQTLKLASSKSKTDMRVRIHRAVVLTGLGRYREATSEWESVLKQGKHDIKARCALAMLNSLDDSAFEKQKSKALEHAKIASRLAGDDNWLCSVAVALAQAANDHPEEAKATAELALTQAIGSQRIRCLELSDRLKNGGKPLWTFMTMQ